MNNEMPSVEVVDVLTKSTIRVNTMLFVDIFRQFFFFWGGGCFFNDAVKFCYKKLRRGVSFKDAEKFLRLFLSGPCQKLTTRLVAWPLLADIRTPVLSPLAGIFLLGPMFFF